MIKAVELAELAVIATWLYNSAGNNTSVGTI